MSVVLYPRFAVVVDLSWIELKPLVSWCVLICDNRGSKRGPTICKKLDSAKRLFFTILKPFCCFFKGQLNDCPAMLPDGLPHGEHEQVEPGLHLPGAVASVDELHHLEWQFVGCADFWLHKRNALKQVIDIFIIFFYKRGRKELS